ncbi:MAG: RNA polymerase sigma factor FliA [Sinobacterium sp.]|nr:RNA polymerase sigma factor FliA [Sinobacterium sp.]
MRGIDAYQNNSSILNPPVIQQYLPLVKKIALHLMARLPATIELDDLVQTGLISLLEAHEKFDASINDNFEVYARIKIRGAMIDLSRQSDWVPRQLPKQMRDIRLQRSLLEQKFQRPVSDAEIITALDIDPQIYYDTLHKSDALTTSSIDGIDDNEALATDEGVKFEHDNLLSVVAKGIENLSENEKLVVSLYYIEELNMKEIAEVLNVSESRVCQVHAVAIQHLKLLWQ